MTIEEVIGNNDKVYQTLKEKKFLQNVCSWNDVGFFVITIYVFQ